jgi:hypothetical protein
MRNASERFVHWRHNSVALPQVLFKDTGCTKSRSHLINYLVLQQSIDVPPSDPHLGALKILFTKLSLVNS